MERGVWIIQFSSVALSSGVRIMCTNNIVYTFTQYLRHHAHIDMIEVMNKASQLPLSSSIMDCKYLKFVKVILFCIDVTPR